MYICILCNHIKKKILIIKITVEIGQKHNDTDRSLFRDRIIIDEIDQLISQDAETTSGSNRHNLFLSS